jgi:uncharacterized protein YjdB
MHMTIVQRRPWFPIALASVFLFAACDEDPLVPPPVPTTVEVSPASVTLTAVGDTETFTAVVRAENGDQIPGATVTWSSSDESVATVAAGLVTAAGPGEATITAKSGDASGDATVTVVTETDPVPAEVVVDPQEVTLTEVGETASLTATVLDADGGEIPGAEVAWSSSDEGVATVDEDGVVTAVGDGAATITATSGDASGGAVVTVETESAPGPAVVVDPAEVTLAEVGETATLPATVLDEAGEEIPDAEVVWSSSDEDVATVDEDGVVTAVGEGEATITATYLDGEQEVTGEAVVTVGTSDDGEGDA